ncbi:MAG: UDP-N-acetylmuramoyl-tripeptide--D-alanyl-D-alanine ligase [Desulfurispora sp.]|uniref:UDP-N-acetylmuramoyl-tripeptide--D-alanyl-D- alanine ligase n=1 Tax=Desulfurispora sp. TaxID=3014275 RepID=UPI0040498271
MLQSTIARVILDIWRCLPRVGSGATALRLLLPGGTAINLPAPAASQPEWLSLLEGYPILQAPCTGVSTDSRRVAPGQAFFALAGQNFDGHQFAGQAREKGAALLVLARPVPGLPDDSVVLLVPGVLAALQALARARRERWNRPLVAVTGSTGKTSTKDLLAAALAGRGRVLKTSGNYNNELGVPLTLLQLAPEHDMAVLEMAMRGRGEIAALCRVARPDAGIITNAGQAHIERLGSPQAVARAKAELLEHIPEKGFALVHGDSPHLPELAGLCPGRVYFFGQSPHCHFRLLHWQSAEEGSRFTLTTPQGEQSYSIPLPGLHQVVNALAAVAVAGLLGLSPEEIQAGLARASLSAMRQEIVEKSGIKFINDAYNANPASMRAALEALPLYSGGRRRVAVLGDMLELGAFSEAAHREIGRLAAQCGLDRLVAVGQAVAHLAEAAVQAGLPAARVVHFPSLEAACAHLTGLLKAGDCVLLKGSRGMRLERVLELF